MGLLCGMRTCLPSPLQVSQLPEKALLGQEELCPLSMEVRDLMWYLHYIPTNSGKLVSSRKDTNQSLTYAPNLNLPSVSAGYFLSVSKMRWQEAFSCTTKENSGLSTKMVNLRSWEIHLNSYDHGQRWTGTRGLAGTKAPAPCKVPIPVRGLIWTPLWSL